MSEYPQCDHNWEIPNAENGEKRLFCRLCGMHYDQAEYLAKLESENKALRKVYKHAKGLCMGIDWNQGTAAQHHRDNLENAVEEATLLLNTKGEL